MGIIDFYEEGLARHRVDCLLATTKRYLRFRQAKKPMMAWYTPSECKGKSNVRPTVLRTIKRRLVRREHFPNSVVAARNSSSNRTLSGI